MLEIIIGNAASLLATITDSISSTRKTTKGMLLMQNISILFYLAASLAFRGYADTVQNIVGLGRNFSAMSKKPRKWLQWLFVAAAVVLGFYFNNQGALGLLPIIANFQYSVAMFPFADNERALKVSFALLSTLYAVYYAFIYNIVGCACCLVVVVTTAVYLFKTKRCEADNN